jgi:prophage regulatory protein
VTRGFRLYGSHEIRIHRRLDGVSRQRAYQITQRADFPKPVVKTQRADFPKPVVKLAQGRVWAADDVDAWMRTHRNSLADDDLND